jgi:hypothetical protein
MKNFDFFVWASDYEQFRGEGLLARKFIQSLFFNSKFNLKIQTNSNSYIFFRNKSILTKKKKSKNNFFFKYLYYYYGILLIWVNYLRGKKVCYINYLPLWNPLIFIFLPRQTILGPITGSPYLKKINNLETFVRKFFFPILFKISIFIIIIKFKKVIFATDNLKKYVPKKKINNFIFNFVFLFYEKKINFIKSIDFVFYYRKHSMKSNAFHERIINLLLKKKFKIIIVGDKFISPNVKNYINLPRPLLLKILKKAKYTIASDENFYNLFNIDCLSCGVRIFYNKLNSRKNNFYFKDNFIPINYNDIDRSFNAILEFTKKRYFVPTNSNHNRFFDLKEKIKFNYLF